MSGKRQEAEANRPARTRADGAPGRVAWIHVAPVKALRIASLDAVEVGPSGIDGDRRFALIDADGRLVNGKRLGRLVELAPTYDPVSRRLTVHFPNGREVSQVASGEDRIGAEFFGRPREARLVRGPVAAAISAWSGQPLRLVELDTGIGPDRGSRGGSVTILSAAALASVAADGGAASPLDPRRFRMTFGIAGIEAHAEDGWVGRTVRIGEALVEVLGNVGRCAVTTQHPESGRPDFDTLGVLARTRGDVPTSEPLPMGVWARVVHPGRVRVGDPAGPNADEGA